MFKSLTLFKLVNLMAVVRFANISAWKTKCLDCSIFLMFIRWLHKCTSFEKLILFIVSSGGMFQ